jgi:hypothetical protein
MSDTPASTPVVIDKADNAIIARVHVKMLDEKELKLLSQLIDQSRYEHLLSARRDLCLPRALRALDAFDAIVLDDLGYVPPPHIKLIAPLRLVGVSSRVSRVNCVLAEVAVTSTTQSGLNDPRISCARKKTKLPTLCLSPSAWYRTVLFRRIAGAEFHPTTRTSPV